LAGSVTGFLRKKVAKNEFREHNFVNTQNTYDMSGETVKLVLTIEKAKQQAFLDMLKLFDFVRVEPLDAALTRFIEHAPEDVPLSEEEVADIVTSMRYNKG
jgi:hypothetical protein